MNTKYLTHWINCKWKDYFLIVTPMKWQYIPFRESILILRMQSSSRCVSQVHQAIMKWNFEKVEGHSFIFRNWFYINLYFNWVSSCYLQTSILWQANRFEELMLGSLEQLLKLPGMIFAFLVIFFSMHSSVRGGQLTYCKVQVLPFRQPSSTQISGSDCKVYSERNTES